MNLLYRIKKIILKKIKNKFKISKQKFYRKVKIYYVIIS